MKKTKSKLEWFKKNIVIVPVVAAIIAGTFTSVRYVLSLTDTITANQETIFKMESKITSSTADINDLKQRLSAAEATWSMQKIYIDRPCLLYTSPSPRDRQKSRMPSSA